MKCPACKENSEFVAAGPHKSRCQNCNSVVDNEALEPPDDEV